MITDAVTEVERVRGHIQLVRELSNELAGYLHGLPEDIWRNPDQHGSPCDRWTVADVVTHIIAGALLQSLTIGRALKQNTSPPMGYRPISDEAEVDRVISLRVSYDEDLFPEFNATCKQLNTLLTSLKPDDYDTPVWDPRSIIPMSRLIEYRALELAVHGWDIRYGLDLSAGISPQAIPFLTDWMFERFRASFQKGESLESPVRYRFQIGDPITSGYDIVISGDDICVTTSDQSDTDVTFRCDAETYILFGIGRLPFSRSVRRGQLVYEGGKELASQFTDWFSPL